MTAHSEIPVKVNAWVDAGVAPLVEALSEFENVWTLASCEDDQSEARRGAYVMFAYEGTGAATFADELATQVREAGVLEVEWRLGEDQSPVLTLSCPPDRVRQLAHALSPSAAV